MAYVIMDECIDVLDLTCIEHCPVDSIYQGARSSYIQPDECIDCGACADVCPVKAIRYADEVPAAQQWHVEDNRVFFESVLPGRDAPLGAPGGAAALGRLDTDTPLVAGHGR